LLSALPAADFERLLPHLELVWMPLGDTLFESSLYPEYVYFPTNAIASLLSHVERGALTEIAVVGNEGILGISQLLVGDNEPGRAVVLSAGYGYRLKNKLMQEEYNHGGPVLRLMLRYAQTLSAQMAVTIACHRQHTIEQQLCRMLLLSLDRLPGNDLIVTQNLIANMLGVHSEGVAQAADKLQRAGLIHYRRGHIDVLNRSGLKGVVCDCYTAVKREVDRLLSDIPGSETTHL
jgi:CRP-like cAMP-binding protein